MSSFSALTLLVGSFDPWKPVPDVTYNVFGGTLNLVQLQLHLDSWRRHYTMSSSSSVTYGRPARAPLTQIRPSDGNCRDLKGKKGGGPQAREVQRQMQQILLWLNPQNCAKFRRDLQWDKKETVWTFYGKGCFINPQGTSLWPALSQLLNPGCASSATE